jgi:hypothetical protein
MQQKDLVSFTSAMLWDTIWIGNNGDNRRSTRRFLACLQFYIRMIMLEHVLPSNKRHEFTEESDVNPVMAFRQIRDVWLIDGEGTPFGYLHRLLNYGLVAAKNTTTRSRIRWSADARTLFFDGRALRMEDWINFVNYLVLVAKEMLSKQLLFIKDGTLPEINLYVVDDPANREAGHYFALYKSDAWKKAR